MWCSMAKSLWNERRDASGRLCLERSSFPSDEFPLFCRHVSAEFQLIPDELVVGFDGMFQWCRREQLAIEISWDIWCGLVLTAGDPVSEALLRGIGVWLERTYTTDEPTR